MYSMQPCHGGSMRGMTALQLAACLVGGGEPRRRDFESPVMVDLKVPGGDLLPENEDHLEIWFSAVGRAQDRSREPHHEHLTFVGNFEKRSF